MKHKFLVGMFLTGILSTLFLTFSMPRDAEALSGGDFNAGRIIDDGIFFNPSGMSAWQIQNFMDWKIASCDTYGTKQSSHWNSSANRYYTRAEWGALNGNPAPYPCLKDYRQDVPSRAPDAYCSGSITAGNKSSAQIISEVAAACSVNPQVILVLLQKEQSLVTDDWPWADQYTAATGFGCPDTASCDPDYAGFFNQVYYGARQYQRYAKQSASFNYRPYTSPFVLYNPNSGCGGTNVYIHNQATAGLYNYTPYQPNQTALNNLYGSGDGCSAYGNRNFWRLYSDWFGSTQAVNANIALSQNLTTNISGGVYKGSVVTASYQVTNTASYDIYAGGLGICGRLNGAYYDFGFTHHNTIPAGGTITLSYSKMIDAPGNLHLFICSYNTALGGWAGDRYPYSSAGAATRSLSYSVQDNPLLTTGIALSPASPAAGQPVTATMTIRNEAATPVNIGSIVIAARSSSGSNVDFGIADDVIVPAGGTYTYSKTRTFPTAGTHSLFVANWNKVWSTSYPKSAEASIVRQSNVNVTP